MFGSLKEHLYSALLPQLCACCRANLATLNNGNACDECWKATTVYDGSERLCDRCGVIVSVSSRSRDVHCWHCDGHHYEQARAIGTYENALASAVIGLKTTPKLSRRVTNLLLAAFRQYGFENVSLIVPVPLSKRRKIERGFNQAEVIADALARGTGIKVDANSLCRSQHSPIHRIGMDRKARDLSVKDAFKVARPKLVDNQSVLIVDDVFTTGATVSYCAKALKNSGARSVNVLTLARATPQKF